MSVDHSKMRLGRTAPSSLLRLRALPLKLYLKAPLPSAPDELHNAESAPIAMYGNDQYGDCTFAALANARAVLSKLYPGEDVAPSADKVVAAYLNYTGGQDVGAVEQDVLNEAQQDGFDFGDTDPWKIDAWAKVDLADEDTCRSVIALFGVIYIGASLPRAAQTQDVWDVGPHGRHRGPVYGPGGWGGHAFDWSGWSKDGTRDYVTWGMVKLATPAWSRAYVDEGYVFLPRELSIANGVDHDQLIADVQAMRSTP